MDDFVARHESQGNGAGRGEASSVEIPCPQPLFKLMLELWNTKRFWFDYAMRKPLDVDGTLYQHLGNGRGPESLDDGEMAELGPVVEMK
jgi:hypothetical protein